MRPRAFVLVLCIAVTVYVAIPAMAQTTFGTILGSVTDPSGAVVPNVTITITNQGENTSREVHSDGAGNYQAENTKEGIYTVSAKPQGFSELTITDIRLTARQTVRVDLKLVVGATSEKVVVEAVPELINTESQTISASVTSTEVLALPANYRGAGSTSPYNLLAFLPGVTGDTFGNISVQGSGVNQVEYSVDGISTTNIRSSGPQREMFPSAESISELQVQGSGGEAQYGNPADITTTSKSGTNVFHGSAFEYLQNAAFDATRFTVPQLTKPAKSANTFGGSLGGPLFGKRTFFFGDYEGMRYRTQTARQETVPTLAMRNGDLSAATTVQLHDLQNNDFPNNQIDPSLWDPRAALILQFYPEPLQPGFFHNHTLNVPNPTLSDQFDIRIDRTINGKQNVFGRWTYKNGRFVSPSGLGLPAENDFEHDNQIVIAHSYAITPNLINELRGGISRRQNGGGSARWTGLHAAIGVESSATGTFPSGRVPRLYL
jgi:hypothetical protein